MADLRTRIGSLEMRNPVMLASGTCGYGAELDDFMDLSELGAIIVKGTTLEPREGNQYPRMAETASGMLNAVGLQNKGIDYFEKNIYPRLAEYDTNVIVNVNGNTIEDYVELSERIQRLSAVPAIELNISCPNVKKGGMIFGTNPASAREVISAVRKVYRKTLIVKLSPNVTDITEFARISEEEGAEAVSLINTLLGMAVDVTTMKPKLSTITGGLSGPAVKPVALRMVWQVARTVNIPVIGLGGIMNATDALEFLMAGATAIQVGTASFIEPRTGIDVKKGIEKFLVGKNLDSVRRITGIINRI
ncbi:MAG: dihydroorotate dehydrogenase [Bacteroidales bacterium]|jgi:dihydroorotate dehydrogenase (NAD+) catalytic subunit|nr:dihydroorotate dehydrogenase [Bacteroidales bacterium]MCB9028798.1 dihydroorotate dehydrogenase [Bacteroidales bacterium]MDD3736953.1 dihydroorotate dehydrogenase [Bacteroidales bacterium]NLD64404.1 dihydroorotate dehydrogenase [Bacteroidales bacterium]HNT93542.1 dihydroorotate dehydrogenase [Bacteroidales bacterium]